MNNDDYVLLEELRAKKKLSGSERAQLKVLERKFKQKAQDNKDGSHVKPKRNVFSTKATTKVNPIPVRFLSDERAGLTELANDIKNNNQEAIILELGSEREINETKLIRAAVYLLKQRSHEEIIEAIKQVKLNMIR